MSKPEKSRLEKYFYLKEELAHISQEKLNIILKKGDKSVGWGKNYIIEIDKLKVFIKKIPLTKLEYENLYSTNNLFNLPNYYNYGVGSAGFGAFRELVAHIKTTNWVINEKINNFPLMYDYRIIKNTDKKENLDLKKHQEYVKYWNNDESISEYIIARKKADYEIILFLEYFPYRMMDWLPKNESKLPKLVKQIGETIQFLHKKEIIHMDIHFGNIITDGKNSYLTDFGLQIDKKYSLSESELNFLSNNDYYDFTEFISCISSSLFKRIIENTNLESLQKYKINSNEKNHDNFMKVISNIREINNTEKLNISQYYLDFIYKTVEINELASYFFNEMRNSEKKNIVFPNKKLKHLIKKTDLFDFQ